jgi:hypothetical protein
MLPARALDLQLRKIQKQQHGQKICKTVLTHDGDHQEYLSAEHHASREESHF